MTMCHIYNKMLVTAKLYRLRIHENLITSEN